MKPFSILLILFIAVSTIVSADDNKAENKADNMKSSENNEDLNVILEELSWLAGRWRGEAFGGRCEEIWSPPSAGSMAGLFKVWKNNKVSFYEIETITIDSSGLALNVKHFNADLTGWEEKDEAVRFPFISAGKEEINFKGITYRKSSDDELILLFDLKDKEGKIRRTEINFIRAD